METPSWASRKTGKEVKRKRRSLVFDNSTFRGRINYALDSLKRMYPTKQIVLLTPIHRGPAQFSDINIQPSEEFCNGCGEYLDTYSLCGLLPSRKEHSRYVPGENDFLHPNEEGHHRIALCVYHQLSFLPCRLDSLE